MRVVLAFAILISGGAAWAAPAPAFGGSGLTVTAGPKWGDALPASWTPYSVTAGNHGGSPFEGEVVLVPQPDPASRPGGPPSTTTTSTVPSTATTVPVPSVAGRALIGLPPDRSGTTPDWPSYRAPVTLPVGTEKTLTVMVMQAPFGFRVELRNNAGAVLASADGAAPAAKPRTSLLLLSDVDGLDGVLRALPQRVAPPLEVFRVADARDFPDDALHLAGLAAVVIDDFDTGSLTNGQRQALDAYVSLGGSLILSSGAAWSRTVGSLPPGLVPLRPSGSAEASLAPLADLAALAGLTTITATPATATVVTGDVAGGQVVLGAPGGPPLAIEADYHAGRVVQLAYDPAAEPIASDESLRGLAWDQALGRIASRWGQLLPAPVNHIVPADHAWARTLDHPPWPGWPRWAIGLVLLFAVVASPATFVVLRRSGRTAAALLLSLTVVTFAISLFASNRRDVSPESVIKIHTLGAEGAVQTATYRGSMSLDPAASVAIGPRAGASTVFSGDPVFRPVGDVLDPRAQLAIGTTEVARGVGGGSVRTGGENPGVQLPRQPWRLRTVETVAIKPGGPAIEAELSIVGPAPGRVTGTVTNKGVEPVRRLTAQVPDGLARLADELAPGATVEVDGPMVTIDRAAGENLVPSTPEEESMFVAADRAFTGPNQIVLAGLTGTSGSTKREAVRVSIVVTVVHIDAAETLVGGSGSGRVVSAWSTPGLGSAAIFDMNAPAGAGPLSVQYLVSPTIPGQDFPTLTLEIYNWPTGTWAPLPSAGPKPNFGYAQTSVDDAEINEGLVRIRARSNIPSGPPTHPQLIPRAQAREAEVPR